MSTPNNEISEFHWVDASIHELSALQLHDLLKLRVDVFVVEQNCVYPELDGQDALATTRHIMATDEEGQFVATARLLAANENKPVRIGRVIVADPFRGTGLSKQLMSKALESCKKHFGETVIELSAQVGADGLYASFGFEAVSEDYLDDGILHRDMRLR